MVSGAHNTIVASRAGKDLVSSLCSGLLTIGDRFGGALNDAAKQFYSGFKRKLTASEFVDETKAKGSLIYGIGHRVKSKFDPDVRVQILHEYVKTNFPKHDLVNYALQVEEVTLNKRSNLILNVDGFIAVSLVDGFMHMMQSESEVQEVIESELLNGFFVLGRTIGIIGHWNDQKRLKQGMYRADKDDMVYID